MGPRLLKLDHLSYRVVETPPANVKVDERLCLLPQCDKVIRDADGAALERGRVEAPQLHAYARGQLFDALHRRPQVELRESGAVVLSHPRDPALRPCE